MPQDRVQLLLLALRGLARAPRWYWHEWALAACPAGPLCIVRPGHWVQCACVPARRPPAPRRPLSPGSAQGGIEPWPGGRGGEWAGCCGRPPGNSTTSFCKPKVPETGTSRGHRWCVMNGVLGLPSSAPPTPLPGSQVADGTASCHSSSGTGPGALNPARGQGCSWALLATTWADPWGRSQPSDAESRASQSVVPGTRCRSCGTPGVLLDMHVLRPHPGPAQAETGSGARKSGFDPSSRGVLMHAGVPAPQP